MSVAISYLAISFDIAQYLLDAVSLRRTEWSLMMQPVIVLSERFVESYIGIVRKDRMLMVHVLDHKVWRLSTRTAFEHDSPWALDAIFHLIKTTKIECNVIARANMGLYKVHREVELKQTELRTFQELGDDSVFWCLLLISDMICQECSNITLPYQVNGSARASALPFPACQIEICGHIKKPFFALSFF